MTRALRLVQLPFAINNYRWCMCGPSLFTYMSEDNWQLETAQGRNCWSKENGKLYWWLGGSERPRHYFDWPPL